MRTLGIGAKADIQAGKAPRVVLEATHENVLNYASLSALKRYALDLN